MNLFLVLLTSVLVSAADYTTYYLYPNGDMPYDNGIEPSQEYDKDGWWHNTAVPLLNLYLPQGEQKGLIVSFPGHYGTRFELLGKEPTQEQLVAWSANKQVTDRTSPCFIVHCQDDDIVPVIHSVMMYEALIQQGVKAELFCPSTGKHGWNLLSEHFSQREACQQAILQFISEITL